MIRRLALLLFAAACHRDEVVATTGGGDAGGGGDGGACAPIVLGDDCAGNVAKRAFRYALCTCDGGDVMLATESFVDTAAGRAGASVGSNARLSLSGTVGGSLWLGGGGLEVGNATLARDLEDAAGVSGVSLAVGGDATIGGDVALTDLRIDGAFTLAEGATVTVTGTLDAPPPVTAVVSIAQPCDCDPDELVDVAGLVLAHAAANDNASIGLRDDALATGTTLDLPCGAFYQTAIGGAAERIHVSGRAALFVQGDVAPSGPFTIELDSGAELDLVVGGTLVSSAGLDATRAGGLRIYVAGAVLLSASGALRANVYGLDQVELSAPLMLEGALFARRLVASAPLGIRYDESVLDAGDACETPAPCLGACGDDSDCCAPLVCSPTGSCEPVID